MCRFFEKTEMDEEITPDENRVIVHGKLIVDRVELEEETFESGGSEIYVNGLSLEVESQLRTETGVKGAVLITKEKRSERSNIILIESDSSKITATDISKVLAFWFPRFIRESEIRIVESIPRSMSGTPILELIWKLL